MPPPSTDELDALAKAHIGHRVSVRYFLGYPGPSGGPAMSDVIGVLESVGPGDDEDHLEVWVLRRRDGSAAALPTDAIVSVRPTVEASRSPAHSTIGVEELERIAAAGWQPLERRSLGDWVLRAADGFTGRANSVLPLGEPRRPLEAALEEVVAFYQERGLRAKFQMPLPLREILDNQLAERDWSAENSTLVMTSDIDDVLARVARVAKNIPEEQVLFADTPSDSWLATYSYRGEPIPAVAREVMTNTAHPVFAEVASETSGNAPAAVARGAVTGSWLGVTAIDVVASHRRRGLATSIVAALLVHARERGCRHVYLQVAQENAPAREMYNRLGFVEHHRYHYRLAPQQTRRDTVHV